MADITMTYESMESAAKKIEQAETDIGDVINALNSAVSALEGSWQGESFNAFKSAWESSRPTMEKLKEAVGAFSPELKAASEAQKEREMSSASKLSALTF